MRRLLTALILCLASAIPARADDPFPYDLDSGREAALFAAGGAMLGAGYLLARDSRSLTPAELAGLDVADLGAWDRGATDNWSLGAVRAGDRLVGILAAAPLGLMVTEPGSAQGGRLARMYAQTMLLSGGTTALLKHLVNRPRPFAYNPDPRVPDSMRFSHTARRSFPSGHSAQAFASMVFFASVYEQLHPGGSGWVWAGCLGSAATVGWLRYQAGYHFPSDIVAGAAIGATAGWLVPRLHEVDDASTSPAPAGASFAVGFAF